MAEKTHDQAHCVPRTFGVTQKRQRKQFNDQRQPLNNNQKGPQPQVASKTVVPPKIWIIGASQITGAKYVALRKYGITFGLDARVSWFGKGGIGWAGVLHMFYKELSSQTPPDILVVHAGGNDLGLVDPNELVSDMERDLRSLRREFPQMKIIFSCLHERRSWRYGSGPNMNKDRKLVNRRLGKVLKQLQCDIVEHPNIRFFYRGIFVADGVHFTTFGNKIFLHNIHKVIEKVLKNTFGPETNQYQCQTRQYIPPKPRKDQTKIAHHHRVHNNNQEQRSQAKKQEQHPASDQLQQRQANRPQIITDLRMLLSS